MRHRRRPDKGDLTANSQEGLCDGETTSDMTCAGSSVSVASENDHCRVLDLFGPSANAAGSQRLQDVTALGAQVGDMWRRIGDELPNRVDRVWNGFKRCQRRSKSG